jgi:hypothetical protein
VEVMVVEVTVYTMEQQVDLVEVLVEELVQEVVLLDKEIVEVLNNI